MGKEKGTNKRKPHLFSHVNTLLNKWYQMVQNVNIMCMLKYFVLIMVLKCTVLSHVLYDELATRKTGK